MKNLIVVLISVTVANVSVGSHGQTQVKIEKPTVRVGDRWTYQNIDIWTNTTQYTNSLTVVAVSENEIRTQWKVLESSGGANADTIGTFVFDAQWNLRIQDPNIETGLKRQYFPAFPSYSFPLELGKSWEGEVKYPNRSGDGEVTNQLKWKVVGWESVTVPAGTSNALKISGTGFYSNARMRYTTREGSTSTIWYDRKSGALSNQSTKTGVSLDRVVLHTIA